VTNGLPTDLASDTDRGQSGFTLLEIVCVMAVVAALAAIIFPTIPRGTSRTTLEAYAVRAAALLKQDHAYSRAMKTDVATALDLQRGLIRSGATGTVLVLPPDVALGAVLARQCRGADIGTVIQFLPSGMSCGGVLTLARLGNILQIRVNWLTGGVEIVSDSST
jgi:general secretion pathway protein H